MDGNKIIRSVCYFSKDPGELIVQRLNSLCSLFRQASFEVQTKRICSRDLTVGEVRKKISNPDILLSVGSLGFESACSQLKDFCTAKNSFFNLDLTDENIDEKQVQILFDLIRNNSSKTFNFTYVFNNVPSSPYFPSSNYERDGFSVGLQATDLFEGCRALNEWLGKMKKVWDEIVELVGKESDFLGIDSSIAPLFQGKSSLINIVKRLCGSFEASVTSDVFFQITRFLKEQNPKPVGLCGLMFPCLEDFELADEYEKGNFSVERNLFLSLQSGLGIDTYPIGIDEKMERVVEILRFEQGLSNKYGKPLSARFVSDGKAVIGEKTDFQNQYLRDVAVRAL